MTDEKHKLEAKLELDPQLFSYIHYPPLPHQIKLNDPELSDLNVNKNADPVPTEQVTPEKLELNTEPGLGLSNTYYPDKENTQPPSRPLPDDYELQNVYVTVSEQVTTKKLDPKTEPKIDEKLLVTDTYYPSTRNTQPNDLELSDINVNADPVPTEQKHQTKISGHEQRQKIFAEFPSIIQNHVSDLKDQKPSIAHGEKLFKTTLAAVNQGNFPEAYLLLNQHLDNAQGTYSIFDHKNKLYLRDAREKDLAEKGNTAFQGFAIMGLNYFHTAIKALEYKFDDDQLKPFREKAVEFLNTIKNCATEADAQEVTAKAVETINQWLMKELSMDKETAEKTLAKQKDFCNLNQPPYTQATLIRVALTDKKGHKDFLHIDTPIETQTEAMIAEFSNRKSKPWYNELDAGLRELVDEVAEDLIAGKPISTIPTQMRELLMPGIRNAGLDGIWAIEDNQYNLVWQGHHMASPGYKQETPEAARLTKLLAEQVAEELEALSVCVTTLISPLPFKEGELPLHNGIVAGIQAANTDSTMHYSNVPVNVGRTFTTPRLEGVKSILNNVNILLAYGKVLDLHEADYLRKSPTEFWNDEDSGEKSLTREQIKAKLNETNKKNENLIDLIQITYELRRFINDSSKKQSLGSDPQNHNVQLVANLKQVAYLVNLCMSERPTHIQALLLYNVLDATKNTQERGQLRELIEELAENTKKLKLHKTTPDDNKDSESENVEYLKARQIELTANLQSLIHRIKGNKAFVRQVDGCVSSKDREGVVRLVTIINVIYQRMTNSPVNFKTMSAQEKNLYNNIALSVVTSDDVQRQAGLHGGTLGAHGIKGASKMFPAGVSPEVLAQLLSHLELMTAKYNHKPPTRSKKDPQPRPNPTLMVEHEGLADLMIKFQNNVNAVLKTASKQNSVKSPTTEENLSNDEKNTRTSTGRFAEFFKKPVPGITEINTACKAIADCIISYKTAKPTNEDLKAFFEAANTLVEQNKIPLMRIKLENNITTAYARLTSSLKDFSAQLLSPIYLFEAEAQENDKLRMLD